MAADNKSEQATPRRRQKAREKGQVARSRELPSALAFAAVLGVVATVASRSPHAWRGLLGQMLEAGVAGATTGGALRATAQTAALWCAPFAAAAFGASLLGSIGQSGLVFAPALLGPKLERISPASRLKNLFSITAITQMAKALVMATVLVWVSWATLEPRAGAFLNASFVSAAGVMQILADAAFALAWKTALVLCAWAAIDYLTTRWQHERGLRMSRDELREEFKESEGNPQMKARIRRLQRQQRRRKMLQDVKRANVVVTNPTHYAVALEYSTNLPAPVVIAKGRNVLAQQIKQIANWHEIPMVENVPLAHALYRSVEIGQAIPSRLYTAVAEILAFVYRAQAQVARGSKR
jgi:flagellar biosynthesis protein FlhB